MVSRAAAWLAGAMILIAGVLKLPDLGGFAHDIYRYRIVPHTAIQPAALVLPWIEIVCGASLIFVPGFRRGAALWAVFLFSVFAAAIAFNLSRGVWMPCGCFGVDVWGAPAGWGHVVMNVALALISGTVLVCGNPADENSASGPQQGR